MFRPPIEPSERISKVSILNAAILVAFYRRVVHINRELRISNTSHIYTYLSLYKPPSPIKNEFNRAKKKKTLTSSFSHSPT